MIGRSIWWLPAAALVAGGGAGAAGRGGPGPQADSLLGETPLGTVFHKRTCRPDNGREHLVVFAPGTGITPARSRLLVRHLGDRTGECVIAVAYENTKLVASYCTTTSSSSGPQDADCLVGVLGAKAASEPSGTTATDGTRLEVPYERSVEGAIVRALQFLGLTRFLSEDGRDARWSRLVLTGHSQGAQLAMYLALTRHRVAGVGSIGGGVLRTSGPSPFPRFVYDARVTDPSRFKAFHHRDDADAFRREVYTAMGIQEASIRTTDDGSPQCKENPHSCVVVDRLIPMRGTLPAFLDQWEWVAAPPR
jgi:hypothetical protein